MTLEETIEKVKSKELCYQIFRNTVVIEYATPLKQVLEKIEKCYKITWEVVNRCLDAEALTTNQCITYNKFEIVRILDRSYASYNRYYEPIYNVILEVIFKPE